MTQPRQDDSSGDSPWGSFSLDEHRRWFWQIGPFSMWLERASAEWQIASSSGEDPLATDSLCAAGWASEPPQDSGSTRVRCAAGSTGTTISVSPALADRSVVVRAEQPFVLFPGDETIFYASSPLWVSVQAGDPAQTLTEQPSFRPSDTWFGPTTREGELCYQSKTRACMVLDELPIRPARALTRIHLRNLGSDSLMFERLKIPIARLGLFVGLDGRHWTHSLVVERTNQGAEAECRVEATAPAEAGETRTVSSPREVKPGKFSRALHALIS